MPVYQNIYLIGFRASGKTTLAARISSSYGLTFLDTDEKIQQVSGISIEEMVAGHGWDYFRDIEERTIAQTTMSRGLVAATGGGAILRESSRNILKDERHLTVYLKARPEVIINRLQGEPLSGQRPPLSNLALEDEIREALAKRNPLYHECSDLVLEASDTTEKLAAAVMEKFTGGPVK
jgi:shikimate kinase